MLASQSVDRTRASSVTCRQLEGYGVAIDSTVGCEPLVWAGWVGGNALERTRADLLNTSSKTEGQCIHI
jgi:hypothetical protein